jgi:PAS domain S-box-containing protein
VSASLSDPLHVLLSDAVPVQLWMATPDGALTFVNARVTAYFGRSEEQMLGEGWQNVVHPSDLATTGEQWRHALETGEPYRTEFRLQRASDGLYRWHLGLALPVRDDDGRIVRWVGSNTDIDDQKRALEVRDAATALAEMERARLEQVIVHAPAVMAIYRGPRHEIVLVNRLWEEFTGRGRDAIGKPFAEAFPETESQGLVALLDEVYETGETFQTSEMHLVLHKDGQPEDTYWTFTLVRMELHQGRGYDLLVHAVEVSEQVRMRRQLEALSA